MSQPRRRATASPLGYEVFKLGEEVFGSGYEVLGLGYEILGLSYKVFGLGYVVSELGYEVLGLKPRSQTTYLHYRKYQKTRGNAPKRSQMKSVRLKSRCETLVFVICACF